ncbi:MAG TPA: alpha/beta hydrolase, partial [Rhizomicrobium sp.]|nr:alpha/beta hydrolase [Rhizomicrobium sp.]
MKNFLIGLVVVIAAIAGALWYFSDPSIPRSVLEAKYATPPSKFVVLANGARVHYRDQGNGPVLVLVHGSNASLFTWEPWVKRLGGSYRVITVDMPGHGLTGAVPSPDYSEQGMVDFLKAFVDKLGVQSFALGGNSMGGGISARFAEENPARVTHLILVDAAGLSFTPGDHEPLAFQLARMPIVKNIMLVVTPRSIVSEGLNDAIVHKNIITDAMIDQYWEFARMEGTRAATMERFSLPPDTYVKDHIGALTMPVLILWGDQDHLIPVASAREFHKDIPG